MNPEATSGPLLLADISGYTSFLRMVAVAHEDDAFAGGAIPPAYAMISGLLDGIVEKLTPPFTLSKLEGDAVFAYAVASAPVPRGAELLECMADCYRGFRGRIDAAQEIWPCRCDACSRIEVLDLKFALHAGAFVLQSIAGGQELVGPEVVLAHRLLKTGASTLIGHGAYALVTEAAAVRLEVPTDGATPMVEHYEHYAPIQVFLYALREEPARS
jgi:hypothetical protein